MHLVVVNARIATMDPANPSAEAVAVKDGVVAAIGPNEDALAFRDSRTTLIDAGGRRVLPGFIEPHNHMVSFASSTLEVDARTPPNRSIDEIVGRLRDRASVTPPGAWVRGTRYDDTGVVDMRHPTRHDLDRATSDHPIALVHNSGHMMCVNSRALELARVDTDTTDPPGGRIGRLPGTSEPDGMFYETAQDLIYRLIPEHGEDDLREAFRSAQDVYLRQGVTTTHDAYVGAPMLDAYRRAQREDMLKLRVNMYMGWDLLQDTGFELRTGDVDGRLRVAGCKLISDGSIQGITAALREPYYCDPGEEGWLIYEQQELNEIVQTLHRNGYQIATHANGDAAIDAVLNAYEHALGPQPGNDRRYRIEHCQVCRPEHLERMARLGVIPDFFANHVFYWGDRHRDRFLGPERVRHLDPVRSAYLHGLRPLLHSDCPVTPISPLFNVQCAAGRVTSSGEVLNPSERVTVEEAVRAVTVNAAFAAFEEETKGTLEIGKLGDLVILDQDPFETPPPQIGSIEVAATIIGGRIEYASDSIGV